MIFSRLHPLTSESFDIILLLNSTKISKKDLLFSMRLLLTLSILKSIFLLKNPDILFKNNRINKYERY